MQQFQTLKTRDGQEFRLAYTINAMIAFEDRTGGDVLAAAQEFERRGAEMVAGRALSMPLRPVRGLIWAGLIEHHPEMTEDAAGKVIDGAGLVAAVTAMMAALRVAFPDPETPDAGASDRPGKPARRGKAAA